MNNLEIILSLVFVLGLVGCFLNDFEMCFHPEKYKKIKKEILDKLKEGKKDE